MLPSWRERKKDISWTVFHIDHNTDHTSGPSHVKMVLEVHFSTGIRMKMRSTSKRALYHTKGDLPDAPLRTSDIGVYRTKADEASE